MLAVNNLILPKFKKAAGWPLFCGRRRSLMKQEVMVGSGFLLQADS
jgi:hypothetical protein